MVDCSILEHVDSYGIAIERQASSRVDGVASDCRTKVV